MHKTLPHLTLTEAMLLALAEGKKGAGFVSPNPLVGCVILDRDGRFLSSGYHERVGESHAEINALKNISDPLQLVGAQVFVTLEPCAHQGKTPSCAKALAKLPIASVTYGLVDPNPLVRGQGAEILRNAGIKVELFEGLQTELEELCEIFLVNMQEQRPFVALKVACTLDGKIAAPGADRWITGPEARTHVQYLRGCYDAVVIGSGTFLQDNPRLNARDPRFEGVRQRVILLDPLGECVERLADSQLLSVRSPSDLWLITGEGIQAPIGVNHWTLPIQKNTGVRQFELSELLVRLRAAGIYSLFIEGGSATYQSFLFAGLVDRVYMFVASKTFGEGLSWRQHWTTAEQAASELMRQARVEKIGEDRLFNGRARLPQ